MRNETTTRTPAPRASDMAGTTREVQRAGIRVASTGGSVTHEEMVNLLERLDVAREFLIGSEHDTAMGRSASPADLARWKAVRKFIQKFREVSGEVVREALVRRNTPKN